MGNQVETDQEIKSKINAAEMESNDERINVNSVKNDTKKMSRTRNEKSGINKGAVLEKHLTELSEKHMKQTRPDSVGKNGNMNARRMKIEESSLEYCETTDEGTLPTQSGSDTDLSYVSISSAPLILSDLEDEHSCQDPSPSQTVTYLSEKQDLDISLLMEAIPMAIHSADTENFEPKVTEDKTVACSSINMDLLMDVLHSITDSAGISAGEMGLTTISEGTNEQNIPGSCNHGAHLRVQVNGSQNKVCTLCWWRNSGHAVLSSSSDEENDERTGHRRTPLWERVPINELCRQRSCHRCPLCRQSFRTLDQLRPHLISHIDPEIARFSRTKSSSYNDSSGHFTCLTCHQRFKGRVDLLRHIREHAQMLSESARSIRMPAQNSRPPITEPGSLIVEHSCHICGEKYNQRNEFVNHMIMHGNELKHQCLYCLGRFRILEDCIIHMVACRTTVSPNSGWMGNSNRRI